MTQLNPDLLRACAAYLAHADVYYLNSREEIALLHPSARAISTFGHAPDADELTCVHLKAIRLYARDHVVVDHRRDARAQQCINVEVVLVARAILDATPNMLAWWCERLSAGEVSS